MNVTNEPDSKPQEDNLAERPWMARQAGYNKFGAGYEGQYSSHLGRAYHRRRSELIEKAVSEHFSAKPVLDVLEIGCGPGLTVEWLCQRTSHRMFGLDFSSTFLELTAARTATLRNRPSLVTGNAMELPFADDSFDLVYATRFIHQFPHEDKMRMAKEIRRVLRPGGLVLIEFYSRAFNRLNYYLQVGESYVYPTQQEHFSHCPSPAEVRDILGADFRIEGLRFLGDRYVNRILGYRIFSLLNALIATMPPLRWLMNEYWAVSLPKSGSVAPAHVAAPNSLFEIVRCPKCRGNLMHDQAAASLDCLACGLRYSVVDGRPNLLSYEAKKLPR